eukprot:11286110-Ditylum_brightwellii.AAC.1
MKSNEEESELDTDLPGDLKKIKMHKVVCVNHQEGIEDNDFPYSMITDSGAEQTVISSSTWSVCQKYDKSLSMSAVDDSMSSVYM